MVLGHIKASNARNLAAADAHHNARESDVLSAIAAYQEAEAEGQNASVRALARKFGIPRSTLQTRLKRGQTSFIPRGGLQPATLLTTDEENIVVDYLCSMSEAGHPLRRFDLRLAVAELILKRAVDERQIVKVGKTWVRRFMNRHSGNLRFRRSQALDAKRAKMTNEAASKAYFETVR